MECSAIGYGAFDCDHYEDVDSRPGMQVCTQCGNFMIFQSLRFYVKSIIGILEVPKIAIFVVSKAMDSVFDNFHQ